MRPMRKLSSHDIVGPVQQWIQPFITGRTMSVAMHGEKSEPAIVLSCVPQGTVLGPFFVSYMYQWHSQWLFADHCLIYREIPSLDDQTISQRDLVALQGWTDRWGMRFNTSKCNILHIHRGKLHLPYLWLLWLCPSSSVQRQIIARPDQPCRQEGQHPPSLISRTQSTVFARHMRSSAVLSPTAVLSIVCLHGTPDCKMTRTLSRRSTDVGYVWFTIELGKTVQWALLNLQMSWSGCPLKPGVTLKSYASGMISIMVLSSCPLNLLNHIAPSDDRSANIRHYVLVPTSIRVRVQSRRIPELSTLNSDVVKAPSIDTFTFLARHDKPPHTPPPPPPPPPPPHPAPHPLVAVMPYTFGIYAIIYPDPDIIRRYVCWES